MRGILLIILFFLLSPGWAWAQVDSNSFNIRIFGSNDVISPTTPVLLSADPVATSQIDITWSASTDNYIVSGYVIERDGSPIATTSMLTYSDSGLTASTTYQYTVKAFDPSYNYSSSSNAIATTTPDIPAVIVPDLASVENDSVSKQGTIVRIVVDDLLIETGLSTSSLTMMTASPARIELRWGKTSSYEMGYVVNEVFTRDHYVLLTELEPDTEYQYEIIGYTPKGIQSVIERGAFQTLGDEKAVNPPNVSRLWAVTSGDDVELSWELPDFPDLAYVRLVRSHLGFPEYSQDGAVVYQGTKEIFTDLGILKQYSPAYYTMFVYDIYGNVSSGAVTLAYADTGALSSSSTDPRMFGAGSVATSSIPIEPVPILTEATSSIETERVTVDMRMPEQNEIAVTQGDAFFTLLNNNITLIDNQPFLISVPKRSIAGNLKSIIATIVDPTDTRRTYSFLLRINQDKTAYEAVVPALGVVGVSQVKVSIYDYEAFVVATYQAPVQFMKVETKPEDLTLFSDVIFQAVPQVSLGLGIFLIGIFSVLSWRKRRVEDNE